MEIIKTGRKWEINTKEDYNKAVETLEGSKFCAMMSDDFYRYQRELEEYENQMADVIAQAKAKGII
jgi:hypothetical protein